MPKTLFENPFKADLNLERYPATRDDTLQAWDSADELLLQHLFTRELKGKRILIVNDAFGALACALSDFEVDSYTDSFLSAQALQRNSQGQKSALVHLDQFKGPYDFVLVKVPKNMSFLEDILCHVSAHLHSESQVIAACRIKHLPKTAFDLLEKIIGPTTTSLAQKKSRLIFAKFKKAAKASPYPLQVQMDTFQLPFVNHSNLFSREKLDIGTRFFLQNLLQGSFKSILDLGCANGIIGIAASLKNPQAKIVFSDESAMAIQSARINFSRFAQTEAEFVWTNGFENQPPEKLDLVLCNPPFHQEAALDESVADQMFRDAYSSLTPGGQLRVVGNSHLMYPQKMKKIFGNSRIIATHPKFLIIESIKFKENTHDHG